MKLKQKLSQFLHSLANKLESEPKPKETTASSLVSQIKSSSIERLQTLQAKLFTRVANLPLSTWRQHPKFWLWLGMGLGASGSALAVGWGVYRLESSLPKAVDDVITYARKDTLTIKAEDGAVLQEIGPVTHEKVQITQVPEPVLKAFVAIEDRRFPDHGGVDTQGILRALFSNVKAGEVVEGGSTITQQLARIIFLSQERSFDRKFREMRIAQKIEEKYSKSQILERYLNLVYLGSGAYGIADAAWLYFSKPVNQLTLAEAATLAGIVPAPSLYSPLENPKAAKERRDLVLKSMAEEGFITTTEAEQAIASPLVTKPSPLKRLQQEAAYFTDYVEKELPKLVPAKALKAGGVVVETTLNSHWQESAEKTVDRAVSRYGRWQNFQQSALVSIDPRSGQIRAMVGGVDHDKNQFNRVTQAKRQPGSTFKPFVYATAIATGRSPYASFRDAEYSVDGYKPENFGDRYSGQNVEMRQALTSSINVVAVQVLVGVGWNPVIKLAHKMGIESQLFPTYSLALGASEVTLLELTSAYGTFANEGVHQPVYGINRVLDRQGKVLYQAKFKPEPALNKNTAAIMTWMLQDVVNSGTGTPAQIGRPVAGKTGTSDKARDLWFVGYIPQLVTGIWLGNDNNKPTNGASTMSAWMWRQFMLEAVKEIPYQSFPKPNLGNRQTTIKAEPLKPRRTHLAQTKRETSQVASNNDSGGEQPTRRRKRYRFRQDNPTVKAYRDETRTSNRERRRRTIARSNAPSQNPAPAEAPIIVPVTVSPPENTSVPLSVTPPPEVTPLAPPAERR